MSQAARDLIGAVGNLRARCDLMLRHLADISDLVSGYEEYVTDIEQLIRAANINYALTAIAEMDSAVVSVDQWRRHVLLAIESQPPNRHY